MESGGEGGGVERGKRKGKGKGEGEKERRENRKGQKFLVFSHHHCLFPSSWSRNS